MVIISFVLLLFLVVVFMSFQKQDEIYRMQISSDAQTVLSRLTENINTISKNGHGYFRYFSLPQQLHGYTPYNVSIDENYIEIEYGLERQGNYLLTDEVELIYLNKGVVPNCISNHQGTIIISDICGNSDSGCGFIVSCDPGDADNCASCNPANVTEIAQSSVSSCGYYGCATDEWHLYKLEPTRSGTIDIVFESNATMLSDAKTDMMIYDIGATGCSAPDIVYQLEPRTEYSFDVILGSTYIIALDSDSQGCEYSGAYTLSLTLT